MKTQILIIFFATIVATMALTDEQIEKLEKFSKPCREETGATLEQIQKSRRGEEIDDPKVKKNILCVFKKLGLVDADGKISEEKMHERVKAAAGTEEKATEICEKCKKAAKGKESPEETLAAAIKCLRNEVPGWSPVE